ncbi:hypothetical protein TrLO_g812 [Triparma laevis f. longispina]|nr:hypothetical protein TrLO_g812 [Triparma laevis f. longispina]
MRLKPSTANLKIRKDANEAHLKHLDDSYALTFSNSTLRAHSIDGFLFLQTSPIKNNPETWKEMYCILDPYTKLVSFYKEKNSNKCALAVSLEGGRVIYGGESPRTRSSLHGGKQKNVKVCVIEITTYHVHTRRFVKHYLGTSDKGQCLEWIRDLGKVVHLGIDGKKKTEKMIVRQEEMVKADRARNLIKQIRNKHKKPSEIERAKELKRLRLEREQKLREELEKNRAKTPKWMKEFSVDGLIEELTKDREEALAKKLGVDADMVEGFNNGDGFEEEEENEPEPEKTTTAAETTMLQPRRKKREAMDQTSGNKHPKLPNFLSNALSTTYTDTRQIMYQHGSATYIQRLYRGRLQRRKFLNSLHVRRWQKCTKDMCYNRLRDISSFKIVRWYRGRQYRRNFIYPIENLFCSEKEIELIRVLKQWLNLAPVEVDEGKLAKAVPKAMYKYLGFIEGEDLNKAGKRLCDLINPKYVGKEHQYATEQCFMCGRPKKACGRLLKSLPRSVRKTNMSKKLAQDLRDQVLDDEAETLKIVRDHTLLVRIAEASLKAVQCRAVGDSLRSIWRKDGREIVPPELPTMLLTIESQYWGAVSQFYRLRGSASMNWALESAQMCVKVCEMQFGGWTDTTGMHIFSDHPSICVSRLHYAHAILCGKSGHRDLKLAMKILTEARNTLYAWTGAKKARETRLKLSSFRNWVMFRHCMVEWRRLTRTMRFYNLRVMSKRIRYLHDGSEVLRAKRERVFRGKAIGKLYDFAYESKRTRELNKKAKEHFFQMFVRRVLYEWCDVAHHRKTTRDKGVAVAASTLHNFMRRNYDVWFQQWWDKETEHRADVHGRNFTVVHYFRRFRKASTAYKNERIASYAIQKTMRRFMIRKKGLIEIHRANRRDTFSRGRVGRYLEDSKIEEKIKVRGVNIWVNVQFVSEQIRRRKSFFLKLAKLNTPYMDEIQEQLKDRLVIPKFAQFSFPTPLPSKYLASRILRDELGLMLRVPVETDLHSTEYFRKCVQALSQHMVVNFETLAEDSPFGPVVTRLPYVQLLAWMEENLPKTSAGFQANMKELVKCYVLKSSKEVRKGFVSDPSEKAAAKFLGVTKGEVKNMMHNFSSTLTTYRTKKVEGVVSTYVPWVLSAAVSNVCKMETGVKHAVEDVHEGLVASLCLGTLKENLVFVENSSRREIAALLTMDRCAGDLKKLSWGIRDLGYSMAKEHFSNIYPSIRLVCDQLDMFRGAAERKVTGKDGRPTFIYAKVCKMELDTLQDIAGFVRGCINEQNVSAKVLSDLSKLLVKRRKIYRKIATEARNWKENCLGEIMSVVGVCETLNKHRRRAEEMAVACLSVRDYKKYERFCRELAVYGGALKDRTMQLYVLNQRLRRRIRAESSALVQEGGYLGRIWKAAEEAFVNGKELMATRREEIGALWNARNDRIEHEQAKHNKARQEHALKAGTLKGTQRAARHTRSTFSAKKKGRHCKYYYEKILVARSKVQKKVMSDEDRWDKYATTVLKFLQDSILLKEIVQHRKPQQKYGLSVSKLHQVELMVEKLLTSSRGMKLEECISKVKPINQRINASRVIMLKQLPKTCNEIKLLRHLEQQSQENENFVKRLKMLDDKKKHEEEHGGHKEMLQLSAAEKKAMEIEESAKHAVNKLLNNAMMAERRISRLNKRLYGGRDKQERAALFVQAVWNYRKIRSIAHNVKEKHLIIFTQNGYRRWHACRWTAAIRIQRWLREFKRYAKEMIKVKAEVRSAKRELLKKQKVGNRLKKDYDKIWDVVNQRYQYKHRKVPGLLLDEKPEILGDDDVLTPRSKRRKNWAEATGGREELNEIEAAHVIVKFMKLTLFKDAGGFLISQQWYGSWVKNKRPSEGGAVVIIQKIVRHQIERWGGKFGKRVSHNNELQKRRLKSKTGGKGGVGLADARPLHEEVMMDVCVCYCSRFYKEGEREREKAERIRSKLLGADKQIREGKRAFKVGKKSGWDTFFSNMMRNANNTQLSLLLTGGGGGIHKSSVSQKSDGWRASVRTVGVAKAARAWKGLVHEASNKFGKAGGGEGGGGWEHDKESDPLSRAMAAKVRTYRDLESVVEREERVKEEEEEEEEKGEEERKLRKTIKFMADGEGSSSNALVIGGGGEDGENGEDDGEDDDSDEGGSNVLVLGRKSRVTFGKFMSLDDLGLDDDEDDDLGLANVDDEDDDDGDNSNVFVIGRKNNEI